MKSLHNVFKHKDLTLPIKRTNEDYVDQLNALLNAYVVYLQEASVDSSITSRVQALSHQLVDVVQWYYRGYVAKAYATFREMMEDYLDVLDFKGLEDKELICELSSLYRTRVVHEYRTYSVSEIFHVPFSLRTKIPSSRYSIAGYPSLYLSSSIELCHYESAGRRNPLKIFSKFTLDTSAVNEVVVLDVAKRPKDTSSMDLMAITSYAIMYPLIAAMSFHKVSDDQIFVPEYIISQFMLEWLREKYATTTTLCGIRYFSSRSNKDANRGFNYAFITNAIQTSTKHCSLLSQCWNISNPLLVSDEDDEFNDLSLIAPQINQEASSKTQG